MPILNKIEMFKNSNFSLIQLMKDSRDKMSETLSNMGGAISQISTPRLTPLKMIDRNRNQLVSKDDIDSLESKIKELEDQIFNAKNKADAKPTTAPNDPKGGSDKQPENHIKLTE
jgi:hypothetical protein